MSLDSSGGKTAAFYYVLDPSGDEIARHDCGKRGKVAWTTSREGEYKVYIGKGERRVKERQVGSSPFVSGRWSCSRPSCAHARIVSSTRLARVTRARLDLSASARPVSPRHSPSLPPSLARWLACSIASVRVCLRVRAQVCFGIRNTYGVQHKEYFMQVYFETGDLSIDYTGIAKQEHLSAIVVELRKLNDRVRTAPHRTEEPPMRAGM